MDNKMTRRTWGKAVLTAAASLAISNIPTYADEKPKAETKSDKKAKVFMTKEITPESLVKIYEALGREAKGRVAVKISTGEPGGHNFLQPDLIKDLVKKVNGTIVECNTAYGGKRSKTEDHLQAAKDHGFTAIAKVDIMDADGEFNLPVKDTTHIKYNIVGTHLKNLAHFKGHAMGGFGGVLKNQSIGVASANGKANIHTAGKVQSPDKLWQNLPQQDHFLESMAAAAQSVADHFGDNILYINVMNKLSVDCDCDAHPHDPKMKDIGIFASLDPVALDQACLDQVYAVTPTEDNDNRPLIQRIERQNGKHTVDHAEKIGLGTKSYELEVIVGSKPVDTPALSILKDPSAGILVQFEGTLQAASALNGEWVNIATESPTRIFPTEAMKFFRAV